MAKPRKQQTPAAAAEPVEVVDVVLGKDQPDPQGWKHGDHDVEPSGLTLAPEPEPAANGRPKTACPVTREQFLRAAAAVTVLVNGQPVPVMIKEFSTGSFGWNVNGKVQVEVGGVPVSVQVGGNLIVVNSKGA